MTQEKKETLTVLFMGTSAIVAMWLVWLTAILWIPDPKSFGFGMMLLPIAVGMTFIAGSATIAAIKILLKKDGDKKDDKKG